MSDTNTVYGHSRPELVHDLKQTMTFSFKYSTSTMACLLSQVQEQVNSMFVSKLRALQT